jgi:hypothetical protein
VVGGVAVAERVPATHRRWILINSILITAFINVVINLVASLAGARGHHVVWWSINPFKTSLLYNTLGTLFLLPVLTALGVNAAIAKEQRSGTLEPIQPPFSARLWSWICVPSSLRRGLRFSVVIFAVLAPIDIVLVVVFGRHGLDQLHFSVLQIAIAVILGMIVTPFIALAAMSEPISA